MTEARSPLPGAASIATACCACPLRDGCPPCATGGVLPASAPGVPPFTRRRTAAGDTLVHEGDPFEFVHAVRSGTFKSCVSLSDGREQVSGFHMAGDIVGLDGAASGRHGATVVALEDTQSCAVSYQGLIDRSVAQPSVQHALHRMLSCEISRGQWHLMLLGRMSAQERLAAFLLDLSRRAAARGYSACEFNLRMTRREIGSYLGLTLETVSRTLTAFKDVGHLDVDNRRIRIVDIAGFAKLFRAQVH